MPISENKRLALTGQLHYSFTPEMTLARARCKQACTHFNNAGPAPRRRFVQLWREINEDTTPLPPLLPDPAEDAALFDEEPWIEAPIRIDYGHNVHLGRNVYINFNCTITDTCPVTIGSRTLIAPNVSLYAATHPLDPELRNGTKGPELGKAITIGEDCWIGGDATILPGVTIGRGATIGAGSVVTRDVPAFCVAAGNPASVLRKIETKMEQKEISGNGTEP